MNSNMPGSAPTDIVIPEALAFNEQVCKRTGEFFETLGFSSRNTAGVSQAYPQVFDMLLTLAVNPSTQDNSDLTQVRCLILLTDHLSTFEDAFRSYQTDDGHLQLLGQLKHELWDDLQRKFLFRRAASSTFFADDFLPGGVDEDVVSLSRTLDRFKQAVFSEQCSMNNYQV